MKMTIGKVAKDLNVGVETIRFYQRKGLIREPQKPDTGGHRHYPEHTVQRLKFIRKAQELEFSLKEIGELLNQCKNSCFDIVTLTELKRHQVHSQIERLTKARQELDFLLTLCDENNAANYDTFFNELAI